MSFCCSIEGTGRELLRMVFASVVFGRLGRLGGAEVFVGEDVSFAGDAGVGVAVDLPPFSCALANPSW